MKQFFSLLFISCSLFSLSQTKITFQYDEAGNNERRYIVINAARTSAPQEAVRDVKALTEKDLIINEEFNDISYYPNPVKEELFVKWRKTTTSYVIKAEVYNLNGALATVFTNLSQQESQNISFLSLPVGLYHVILTYKDGTSKILKIAKK
jgi:Secretion system C-terminal sorting domain